MESYRLKGLVWEMMEKGDVPQFEEPKMDGYDTGMRIDGKKVERIVVRGIYRNREDKEAYVFVEIHICEDKRVITGTWEESVEKYAGFASGARDEARRRMENEIDKERKRDEKIRENYQHNFSKALYT